ncbi:TetR family transcriptional regulator [Bifidobacterium sp.]|jgi:AcrR family transcriptional regulator|uniref:TetR family transcriptional regulator n=1 Tax=Bifidobacterium sp. TaxID=41200 RepID=UPI0025C61C4A|nr:TetR family transcriptional regulator [Bifidobacterium sp.]MCI1634602.1 TetR family transcriptional regulator [Bifidobacterium sp.]
MTNSIQRPQIRDLRARRRQQLVSDVQQVALSLIETNGFASTTVDDIARSAGISTRTFFRYFPSKEDAVLAGNRLLDEAIDDIEFTGSISDVLTQLEQVYREHLKTLRHMDQTGLRSAQCLIEREPALQDASAARDAATLRHFKQRLDRTWPSGNTLAASLAVEVAAATLRAAIEGWRRDTTKQSIDDLISMFDTARKLLREATSQE